MQDPFVGSVGVYWHAETLWSLARRIADRMERPEQEQDPYLMGPALTVLLFAAMSVETFLNELEMIASNGVALGDQGIRPLRDALREIEASRGSIRLKVLMLGVACGRPFDTGAEPFQGFDLLFRLRDVIVHLKPQRQTYAKDGTVEFSGATAKLLDELYRQRHLIADPTTRPARSVLQILSTSRLCLWALEAAAATIKRVVDILPEGASKRSATLSVAKVIGLDMTKWAGDAALT